MNGDYTLEPEIACRRKSHAVCVGMMSVIVGDYRSVDLAMILKSPSRSVIVVKPASDPVRVYTRGVTGRGGGKRVVNIVSAGNGQIYMGSPCVRVMFFAVKSPFSKPK